MNKIKQNKITFLLILIAILVTFSSLTILSLPVLFKYKSKVPEIEKNFYNNFKVYLNISGNVSYKPFPKPHLLVEKASLNLNGNSQKNSLINTKNLKIFISLKDLYSRTLRNLVSIEVSNTNIELDISKIKEMRNHLYKNLNNPIHFINCQLFLKNKNNEVILISPIKNVSYKINTKTKDKNFIIEGKVFGIDVKSKWNRNYKNPEITTHNINLLRPNFEIKNILNFKDINSFIGQIFIENSEDKFEYNYELKKEEIKINSPDKKNINFKINSDIKLNPFYFNGELSIKNKKLENIIDGILLNLLSYDKNYLGNLSGKLKIKFNNLDNRLIKNGEAEIFINEQKIFLRNANFELFKIGTLKTNVKFIENQGDVVLFSNNELKLKNHIEFAKVFQIGSNKVKNIKRIYFDLEKNVGDNQIVINNVKINNKNNISKSDQKYIVKNIQNLRASIRKVID